MNVGRKRWSGRAMTSAFAFSVAASMGTSARSAEFMTDLDYRAVAGCPGAADFGTVVAGRLGYNPFRKDAAQRVVVRITRSGNGLEGRLEWRDAAGVWLGDETLPSRTGNCTELVRAMGFALAIQFQLMATVGDGPRATQPPASPTRPQPALPTASPPGSVATAQNPTLPTPSTSGTNATPSTTDSSPAPPPRDLETVTTDGGVRAAERTPSGPSLLVGAGAAVAIGAATNSVPVGRLFGAAVWPHALIELAGELDFPSSAHLANGTGFSQREVFGSLAGCGVLRPWGVCLLAKVGEIRVTGQGVDVPTTSTGILTQAGIRLIGTHMVGDWVEVTAHADGLVSLTTGTVTLDSTAVWSTPRFAAIAGLDVGIRFR